MVFGEGRDVLGDVLGLGAEDGELALFDRGLKTPPVLEGAADDHLGLARWGRRLVVVGLGLVLTGTVAADVIVRTLGNEPGLVGPALAVALLVAGAGSGLVIAPNQTLALAHVPVGSAGVAGSMIQVGQRVGTAVGVSIVLSVYYGGLASGADGAVASGRAMLVTIGFVAVALVVGVVDLRSRRAEGHGAAAADA